MVAGEKNYVKRIFILLCLIISDDVSDKGPLFLLFVS